MKNLIITLALAALVVTSLGTTGFAEGTEAAEKVYAEEAISRFPIPSAEELPEDVKKTSKPCSLRT